MLIGPQDSPGDETFQITVCTPQAITALLDRDGVVVGHHLLLVSDIDPAKIEAFLHDRLRRLDGNSWGDLARRSAVSPTGSSRTTPLPPTEQRGGLEYEGTQYAGVPVAFSDGYFP